jgi:hypothetical protein
VFLLLLPESVNHLDEKSMQNVIETNVRQRDNKSVPNPRFVAFLPSERTHHLVVANA